MRVYIHDYLESYGTLCMLLSVSKPVSSCKNGDYTSLAMMYCHIIWDRDNNKVLEYEIHPVKLLIYAFLNISNIQYIGKPIHTREFTVIL